MTLGKTALGSSRAYPLASILQAGNTAGDRAILAADGTAALPGLAFEGNPNTGLSRLGANRIGLSANGALVLEINTSGLAMQDGYSYSHTSTATSGSELSIAATPSASRTSANPILKIVGAGTDWVKRTPLVLIDGSADNDTACLELNSSGNSSHYYINFEQNGTTHTSIAPDGVASIRFVQEIDASSGNPFVFTHGSGDALTDTNAEQTFFKIDAEVSQSATAAYNIHEITWSGGVAGSSGSGDHRGLYINAPTGFTGDGIRFDVNGSEVFAVNQAGNADFDGSVDASWFNGNVGVTGRLDFNGAGGTGRYGGLVAQPDDGEHLCVGNANSHGNRNLIITDAVNRDVDHNHDTLSANPTQFWQSVRSPAVSDQEWGSATHDGSDFVLSTGGPGAGTGSAPTTIRNAVKVDAEFVSTGGRIIHRTAVAGATYTTLVSDYYIGCTGTGSTDQAIELSTASETEGRVVVVKDESGNASGHNITVSTEGATTIDGGATVVLNGDYDSARFVFNGTNWGVN